MSDRRLMDVDAVLDALGERRADVERMEALEAEVERLKREVRKYQTAYRFLEETEQRAQDTVKPLREENERLMRELRDERHARKCLAHTVEDIADSVEGWEGLVKGLKG